MERKKKKKSKGAFRRLAFEEVGHGFSGKERKGSLGFCFFFGLIAEKVKGKRIGFLGLAICERRRGKEA